MKELQCMVGTFETTRGKFLSNMFSDKNNLKYRQDILVMQGHKRLVRI